jgi:gamma-glutamyl hercynylcysteine S-oxide synthase
MHHEAFAEALSPRDLIDWYRRARNRTRQLFDLVKPEAMYERPIPLRNPLIFYEGHLPGFCVNTLVKLALGREGVDADLERLFARGIDPDSESAVENPTAGWPERDAVRQFAAACDALVEETLATADLEDDAVPHLRGGEAALAIMEHELMHQETLIYMLHNLPHEMKRRPDGQLGTTSPHPTAQQRSMIRIPPGEATLGKGRADGFGWDNELPSLVVAVDEFEIDSHNVTNGEYLEYVAATGAAAPHFWIRDAHEWRWRGMFDVQPLLHEAPVYVTFEEATAYAQWKGGRLPTEAEFHRAAYGTPSGEERRHPWGDEPPRSEHGNFGFERWDPVAAGSHPAGASAWGAHDLVGNGWEWTSTLFRGFPGFEPMPSYPVYSADFFDDAHYVMKGASPVTARELVRRSFRNWFRPDYPYVYGTFRCAR